MVVNGPDGLRKTSSRRLGSEEAHVSTRYQEDALLQRIASRRALRRHLLVSVSLLVVAVAGSISDVRAASALVIAAAAASGLFTAGLQVARASVRDAAIDAVARGDAGAVAR